MAKAKAVKKERKKKAPVKQDYERMPTVDKMINEMIQLTHRHLERAKVYAVGKPKGTAKMCCGGTAKLMMPSKAVKALVKDDLGDVHFVAVIGLDKWEKLDQDAKKRVIDHLCCHAFCGEDGGFSLLDHDVSEFVAVIKRHGLDDSPGLRAFAQAAKQLKLV
jgi:hypothetical protein